jgi:hypothetical protein
LKNAGSILLMFKSKPPRFRAVTWPEELLQPTPTQRQQSVPACQDGRVVVEYESNKNDCFSLSRALA